MINAGVILGAATGNEAWVSPNWVNIKLNVRYPPGQNRSNNPISTGDYMIDQLGQVWKVNASSAVTGQDQFVCSLEFKDGTASQDIVPDIGGTSFGCITTPVSGKLAPFWDATYVSDPVYRKAREFSVKNIEVAPSIVNEITNLQNNFNSHSTNLSSIESQINTLNTDVSGLQTLINSIQTTVDGLSGGGSGGNIEEISVTSWASSSFTMPSGWSAVKTYSNSALQVTHNMNKLPTGWFGINLASSPKTFFVPTSTRNLQVVDSNTVVFTQCAVSDTFKLILFF